MKQTKTESKEITASVQSIEWLKLVTFKTPPFCFCVTWNSKLFLKL